MKVMYTCDNNYVWLMEISVISLFENNKAINDLKVYLLGEKISQENKDKLTGIAKKYDREIYLIDVPKLNIPLSFVSARWPLSAYTRLFSGIILPDNVDRILYLDCDTVVTGDISELDNIEFNGKIFMGIKDWIGGIYKENIGLKKDSLYINAGVILINVNELRKININNEIELYMSKYGGKNFFADQDILNGIFKGKIGELSPRFNVKTIDVAYSFEDIKRLRRPTNFCSKEELIEARTNPAIIHYTTIMGVIRPWFSNTNHPFAAEFRKYMNISDWKDRKFNEMVFNSKEEKMIGLIMKLPNKLACSTLGLLHSKIRPLLVRFNMKLR